MLDALTSAPPRKLTDFCCENMWKACSMHSMKDDDDAMSMTTSCSSCSLASSAGDYSSPTTSPRSMTSSSSSSSSPAIKESQSILAEVCDDVLVTEVDARDKNTPDNWIPRYPDLIRLTGKHPFNCEPPLSLLHSLGFITPAAVHYVRNHGPVPRISPPAVIPTSDRFRSRRARFVTGAFSGPAVSPSNISAKLIEFPKADAGSWAGYQMRVSGCLFGAQDVSLGELALALPVVTIPVTLVCAGNRRKEQNLQKQSRGFSWGAAAVSTSFWTGIRLCDILEYCGGVRRPNASSFIRRRADDSAAAEEEGVHRQLPARFVSFTGSDVLPQGHYGTGIDIGKALDPYGDVLIAFLQNGEPLLPDHGFPARVIIPGWIGGRMVKWVKEIAVTHQPPDNFYHFKDNRILPSQVHDVEMADRESWWTRPEYLFNELNINSAVCSPEHGEKLYFSALTPNETYTLKGYAYSGGGRKVTRVEVSIDGAKSWRMAAVDYPEERMSVAPDYGRYWCWSFWELEVTKGELLACALTGSKEIAVRAWDSANNLQPEVRAWNLLGMGNNCHFKVKLETQVDDGGKLSVLFRHPAVVGNTEVTGWMDDEVAVAQQAAAPSPTTAAAASSSSSSALPQAQATGTAALTSASASGSDKASSSSANTKKIPMSEVRKHTTEDDCWIVIEGKVYDCTPFMALHPGGSASILMNAGEDCTQDFADIHSKKAWAMLDEYYVGDVCEEPASPSSTATPSAASQPASDPASGVFLDAKKWKSVHLCKKTEISSDTKIFRFALDHEDRHLGLPIGGHVYIKVTSADGAVVRAYTPTSSEDDLGFFDLLVKVYQPTSEYPEGGVLTQRLDRLQIGDQVQVKGPLGHFSYLGKGMITLSKKESFCRRIGFLCGGTGITPAYQIIRYILQHPGEDGASGESVEQLSLVYSNRTFADMLLFSELLDLAKKHPKRLNIRFLLSREAAPSHLLKDAADADNVSWSIGTGRVTETEISEHLFPSSHGMKKKKQQRRAHLTQQTVVGLCGPPGMLEDVCVPSLKSLGFSSEQIFEF